MTPAMKAMKKLKSIQEHLADDPEGAHSEADQVLCNLLIDLGCKDIVEEWSKIPKWYA